VIAIPAMHATTPAISHPADVSIGLQFDTHRIGMHSPSAL
jgi:hypothetical protein